MNSTVALSVLIMGVGATAVMDLWALLLKKAFATPSLNYCLLGRWLQHMPSGRLVHASIAQASPKPLECHLGWAAHYLIGVVFAAVLVAAASPDWLARPTLGPALLLGLLSVVLPFFVMQPALGLGWAACKTPRPQQARLKSLMAHTAFGLGLYLCAQLAAIITSD